MCSLPNSSLKPLAALALAFGAPRLFAHGFAMIAHMALRTKRRLLDVRAYKAFFVLTRLSFKELVRFNGHSPPPIGLTMAVYPN